MKRQSDFCVVHIMDYTPLLLFSVSYRIQLSPFVPNMDGIQSAQITKIFKIALFRKKSIVYT